MSLNKFISVINDSLAGMVQRMKVYGLAEPVTRGNQVIPGIVRNEGEIIYPGPDDIEDIIIYHKATALATALSQTVKGTGDDPNASVNAYGMSMIVYLDRKKTKLTPDELFLYIQARIPYQVNIDPYVQVLFRINNVILNGQQVYDSEFKGTENRLPANHSMLQINYTIESTFHKRCFEKCPEDC